MRERENDTLRTKNIPEKEKILGKQQIHDIVKNIQAEWMNRELEYAATIFQKAAGKKGYNAIWK